MIKKILILFSLMLTSKVYSAAMYGLNGKVVNYGPRENTDKFYVELERSNGTRYRIIVDEQTLELAKNDKNDIFITAPDSDIYTNFGKGYKFSQIENGTPF